MSGTTKPEWMSGPTRVRFLITTAYSKYKFLQAKIIGRKKLPAVHVPYSGVQHFQEEISVSTKCWYQLKSMYSDTVWRVVKKITILTWLSDACALETRGNVPFRLPSFFSSSSGSMLWYEEDWMPLCSLRRGDRTSELMFTEGYLHAEGQGCDFIVTNVAADCGRVSYIYTILRGFLTELVGWGGGGTDRGDVKYKRQIERDCVTKFRQKVFHISVFLLFLIVLIWVISNISVVITGKKKFKKNKQREIWKDCLMRCTWLLMTCMASLGLNRGRGHF